MRGHTQRHILVIVQNLPIQVDRRVLLEIHELMDRGYRVSLICPKGPGDPSRETLDGASIYKYAPPPEAKGAPGYLLEFVYCWLRTALLSIAAWHTGGRFHVIQACNPPDTYWLLALLWRVRGVKFIFDHHDLNPELFLSRFGNPSNRMQRLQLSFLKWLERMTFRSAHRVISTNDSYRGVAMSRGKRKPGDVDVVRSGPDTVWMRPIYPSNPVEEGITMLAYLGIMGPQDGVDKVLDLVRELRGRGRTDIRATIMGFGDCLQELRAQCTAMGLDDIVRFTGRVGKEEIAEELSRAHIGVSPDLKTPLNDLSTMNKTLEYMAFALPSVAFDLKETRVTGGDTVRYVESGDIRAMADEVEGLIQDPDLRVGLSRQARERVVEMFDWAGQARVYGDVFDEVLRISRDDEVRPAADLGEQDDFGRRYVPLDEQVEFERFLRERRALIAGTPTRSP